MITIVAPVLQSNGRFRYASQFTGATARSCRWVVIVDRRDANPEKPEHRPFGIWTAYGEREP